MESLCTSPCAGSTTGAVTQYMSLMLNFFSVSQCSLSPPEMWPEDYGEIALETGFQKYDFIVVGAGSSGSVVASRLSENPNWKILHVEAGGDPPAEAAIPGLSSSLQNTEFDWQYESDALGRETVLPKGKMLGGTSSINGMQYVRGNADDYNTWEALGNPTWGWDDVLAYYKKSEANQDFGGEFHSQDGPMSVELGWRNKTVEPYVAEAAEELGLKFVESINGEENIGYTYHQITARKGVRESTATAFLVPAKNRTNLHVVKNAHVLKLIIKNNRALGVKMNLRGQRVLEAFARKEVILSAGAFGTPQILMLSGIGPALHLWEMGIPVIRDLSVGKNLHDHIGVFLSVNMNHSEVYPLTELDKIKQFFSYMTEQTGPLSSSGSAQPTLYINAQNPNASHADFQILQFEFPPDATEATKTFPSYMRCDDFLRQNPAARAQDPNTNILLVVLVYFKEKSRGAVELRSLDPLEQPQIDFNLLSDEADIDGIVRGIREYQKLLATKSFRRRDAKLLQTPLPQCDILEFNTDEYWRCFVQNTLVTFWHSVGTAKMGPSSDPDAVVDYRLRVRGVKSLRVIDSSIMPIIPSGNTNAPAIMIAEKGSDFIKEDWGFK